MLRLLPFIGVITSLFGGVRTLRDSRQQPRNWRTYLVWAGAAITIVLSVADAVGGAKAAKEQAELEQSKPKRGKR